MHIDKRQMKLKINPITTLIAVAICALIAYGFYSFGITSDFHSAHHLIIVFSTFAFSSVTLAATIGINFETSRITTVIRTVSFVFFCVGLIASILLNMFTSSIPLLIITMGILFLIFVLLIYSLSKTDQ